MRNTVGAQEEGRGQRLGCEGGQSTAEIALVLAALLVLILGILDLSRAVYAQNVLAMAAREGARYASTHPDVDDEATRDAIVSAAKALIAGIDKDAVTVTPTKLDSAHVQVEVTYTFRATVQFIGQALDGGSGSGITLRARSRMRIG